MVARDYPALSAVDLWEFSHLPENEGRRFELSEGELIEMALTGGQHGEVTFNFGLLVGPFVKQHKLGYLTAAETGYILYKNPNGKDTVRAPDLGFVAADRLPEGLPPGWIPIPPDLAVEVVSPNDKAVDVESKVNDYLRYGTRMVLVVYPDSRTMLVRTPNETRHLNTDDIFEGGDVLPGFKLAVKDIFPD